jgi:hypothetical protein
MCKRELAETIARSLDGPDIDQLRVCVECQSRVPGRPFGGKWVKFFCDQQGVDFRPARMTKLANRKLLTKCEGSRQGDRRDYRIDDDAFVRLVLMYGSEHAADKI